MKVFTNLRETVNSITFVILNIFIKSLFFLSFSNFLVKRSFMINGNEFVIGPMIMPLLK